MELLGNVPAVLVITKLPIGHALAACETGAKAAHIAPAVNGAEEGKYIALGKLD